MSSEALVRALVASSNAVVEIVGELHSLHYCGRLMTPSDRARAIATARENAEALLASIVEAEGEIATRPAPTIIHLEAAE